MSEELTEQGIEAVAYHSELTTAQRKEAHKKWLNGEKLVRSRRLLYIFRALFSWIIVSNLIKLLNMMHYFDCFSSIYKRQ